jgi:hypothetical protein
MNFCGDSLATVRRKAPNRAASRTYVEGVWMLRRDTVRPRAAAAASSVASAASSAEHAGARAAAEQGFEVEDVVAGERQLLERGELAGRRQADAEQPNVQLDRGNAGVTRQHDAGRRWCVHWTKHLVLLEDEH